MSTTILQDKDLSTAEGIRIATELSVMTRKLRWAGSPATYTMFSIYNKWYTGVYGEGIRRPMSMNCRPCIDKVMDFFLKLDKGISPQQQATDSDDIIRSAIKDLTS